MQFLYVQVASTMQSSQFSESTMPEQFFELKKEEIIKK
jgi:hypothetical protein